jgi:hypothetical protein
MKNFLVVLSLIVGGFSFSQVTLLYETFDSGFPVGWERINNDGNTPHPSVSEYTEAWIVIADPDNSMNSVVSSTSYFQPVDRADRWLITPEIELGASGNFVSWYGRSQDPSFPDAYKVLISTTGSAISDFQDTLVLIGGESPDWLLRNFEITGFENETIRLAFVNTTFNGFKLYLDTIHVRKEDPASAPNILHQAQNIQVYPNPASGYFKIKGAYSQVQVYAPDGRCVLTEDQGDAPIDIHHLPKGIYTVRIFLDQNQVVTKKLVVQ